MIHFNLAYDMRAPEFGAKPVDLYRAALDQCAWADPLGCHSISFMEHHATADGFLPSPIVMAAAAAARTKKTLIRVGLMLLPFYHPLRAAEDLAVLDLIAGGRLRLVVGAGYREEEYAQFGLSLRQRPTLMTQAIEALKKSWTGEPFEHDGALVRILPRPMQRPRPAIQMGGNSRASAERAARIADGFSPDDTTLFEHYRQTLAAMGKPVPPPRRARATFPYIYVSDDPEADWATIAPHAMHDNKEFAGWLRGAPDAPYREAANADELRATGRYRVVTPTECIELARREGTLSFKPLLAGLDPSFAWRGLRRFEAAVLPSLGQ